MVYAIRISAPNIRSKYNRFFFQLIGERTQWCTTMFMYTNLTRSIEIGNSKNETFEYRGDLSIEWFPNASIACPYRWYYLWWQLVWWWDGWLLVVLEQCHRNWCGVPYAQRSGEIENRYNRLIVEPLTSLHSTAIFRMTTDRTEIVRHDRWLSIEWKTIIRIFCTWQNLFFLFHSVSICDVRHSDSTQCNWHFFHRCCYCYCCNCFRCICV